MTAMPEVGKKAPAFTLPRDSGEGENTKVQLSKLKGQNVVLYFYPKDMTPGCTTESIDFSTLAKEFEAQNTVIIGISKDSVERHDKFIAKHDLNLILASDEDGAIIEKYGVWQEKKLYGKVYMGIVRSTFLIDETGKVAAVWPKVRVKAHAQAVLDAVKSL